MIAFATISGVISDQDAQDIAIDLLESIGSETDPCDRLIVCTEAVTSSMSFTKLSHDRIAVHEASLKDSHILCACLEFVHGKPIDKRLLVDEMGDHLPSPKPLKDELGLRQIESLLDSGQTKLASALAGALRKELQTRGSLLCARLAEALGQLMLFADVRDRCQSPTFPEDGAVLRRRGIDVDAKQFLNLCDEVLNSFQRSCPVLFSAVAQESAFINEGRELAAVAFRSSRQRFDFFVWLSVYFLRAANLRLNRHENAEALSLSVRALECYATFYLTLAPEIYLDGGAFYWCNTDKKLTGTGELLARMEARLGETSRNTFSRELELCKEAIELRNRSLFGHGVQKMKTDHLATYPSAVRRLIAGIEGLDDAADMRWKSLWGKSLPTASKVLANLISGVLATSLKFGHV